MRRALFLDRDGTISPEIGFLDDVERVELLPRAAEAIRLAETAGFVTVLVTNQSGVARGLFSEARLDEIHGQLQAKLKESGATLADIYYCPHHPDVGPAGYRKNCRCRKPNPGMLLRAGEELGLDLKRSYMVGDRVTDIEAGRRAGTRTALVRTGLGDAELRRFDELGVDAPDYVAGDLLAAVRWIVGDCRERVP
jgi:D-glycero-D-manno-heptose 1,7-bisphosphate phosphatase